MVIAAFISVKALCYAAVASAVFAIIISSIMVTRICELTLTQLLKSFIPYLGMALIANIPSFYIDTLSFAPVYRLGLGVTVSLLIYGILLWIKRDSAMSVLVSYAKEKIFSKRHA